MSALYEDISAQENMLEVDERMKALASIYQLTDFIVAGERLTVKVERLHNTNVPAFTNGTDIVINSQRIDTRDFDDLVRLHGLNFHELAHVMYSPRAGTALMQWVVENDYIQAANVLEDQRIESLLSTKYPSVAPWLTAAVMRWVLDDPAALGRGYMFVRGRRYLPGSLRGLLRANFEFPQHLASIDRIVDEYRRLVFPTDYDRAQVLIAEFAAILNDIAGPYHGSVADPNGHCHHTNIPDRGRPTGVKEQRELRDRMSDKPSRPSDEKSTEESDDSPTDSQNGYQESAGKEPIKDADGDYESSQDSADSISESSNDHSNDGQHAGAHGQRHDPERDKQRVEDMLNDLLDSREVRSDILRVQRQIRGAMGDDVLTPVTFMNDPALPEFSVMVPQLVRALERIREEADPGWHREEESGRLNVIRWAVDKDPHTAFDRWDEGVNDVCDIEAVVMLDVSGSMNSVSAQTYNAMWAIKRAFDYAEIATTVIIFDDESNLLYRKEEKAGPTVRTTWRGGGTDPVMGLQQASRILMGSKRRHKVLIVITDGTWCGQPDEFGLTSNDHIKQMNESGVLTAVGFVSSSSQALLYDENGNFGGWIDITDENMDKILESYRHGAKISAPAHGANLVPFVSGIVTNLMKQRLVAR